MALLKAVNLKVGYDSHIVAEPADFEVKQGDYLCIVGENGAGKTTLMKTILGLLNPVSGELSLGDGLTFSQIGYLPQQTDIQKDFPASVTEVVISGCQGRKGIKPFYDKVDKALATKAMEQMGIYDLRRKCYRELSGGQQQRVLLARALSAASRMILLDEPVAGLDPAAASGMYSLIERLNEDGMTVIMISHDIGAALGYASHILEVGSRPFFGSRNEYMDGDRSNDQYIKSSFASDGDDFSPERRFQV